MKEIWKDIPYYEGLYQASNLGKIRSLDKIVITKNKFGIMHKKIKGKILKLHKNEKEGYIQIILCKSKKNTMWLVHRLIAITFLDNPNNYKEINHINGIKDDNRVENLEWCDRSYNIKHSFRLGLSHSNFKVKSGTEHHFYGKHHSDETKKKMSLKHCKKVKQYDKNNNFIKIWNSTIEVEKELHINGGNISLCCNNKRKSVGGYIWRYVNEE